MKTFITTFILTIFISLSVTAQNDSISFRDPSLSFKGKWVDKNVKESIGLYKSTDGKNLSMVLVKKETVYVFFQEKSYITTYSRKNKDATRITLLLTDKDGNVSEMDMTKMGNEYFITLFNGVKDVMFYAKK